MNINQFEDMRNFAELKALSAVSLESPLSDSEYKRVMELKNIFLKGGLIE